MANRNLVPAKILIFKNKLEKILSRLQDENPTSSLQTKEALTAEAAKLLSLFYKELKDFQFKNPLAVKRTLPELKDYNLTFQSLSDDISILFSELENLETVVVDQFNTITTQANRINSRVKKLGSNLVDLKLYSKLPIKNNIFVSDSFNNTLKIESNSSLLNTQECQVNNAEGIVTLPLDLAKTKIVNINLLPLINTTSNGRSGNNQELGIVNRNSSLRSLTDSNSDSWFEYERVVKQDDGVPLILDLTFNLNKEEIINFIRINPNNFGTKTEIEILDISTSVDGKSYKSIKDEILIENLNIIDEQNIFKLAPSTSKFAGQGLFTFTPRYGKYVNIKLKQSSPYIITTVQGSQFRYAIGLRDIEISQQAYLPSGELVSSSFEIGEEIKKIALKTEQSFIEQNELGSIDYEVSVDNGNSWIGLAPLESKSLINIANKKDEVLNINTQDPNSVNTENPVTGFRYKIKLNRSSNNFNENSFSFVEDIAEASELKVAPVIEPWVFSLEKKPIPESIFILDTNFGSRGDLSQKTKIGKGSGNKISFNLPWDNLVIDPVKNNNNSVSYAPIYKVYVGGEEWSEVPSFEAQQPEDKVFRIKRNMFNPGNPFLLNNSTPVNLSTGSPTPGTLVLEFGDGTNGKAPEVGSLIEVGFTEERLFLIDEGKTGELVFPCGSQKAQMSIFQKGNVIQDTVELSSGSNIHILKNKNLIVDNDHTVIFTNQDGDFVAEVPFKNGQIAPDGELANPGEFSIDKEAGIIYSFNTTDETPGTVSYFFQEYIEVPLTGWKLKREKEKTFVTIEDSNWEPLDSNIITVASGVTRIFLPNLSVIKNSLVIEGNSSLPQATNPFLEEVDFINGYQELSTIYQTEQSIPVLTPSPSIATFSLDLIPVLGIYNISFSNLSVFLNKVNSLIDVNSVGKYFIDGPGRTVHVHTGGATITDPGKVIYYTTDLTRANTGKYSVDYKNGIIYLQRAIPIPGITLKYKHSNYFIRYNIGRKVSPENFSYNFSNNSIQLLPGEIKVKNNLTDSSILSTKANYQITYNYINSVRKNIKDLEPFFTPIVKEVVFQVIPSKLL